MPGLLETITIRKKKFREAAGLSNPAKSEPKKETIPLKEQHPEEFKKYLLDPASDDISFREFLKKNKK